MNSSSGANLAVCCDLHRAGVLAHCSYLRRCDRVIRLLVAARISVPIALRIQIRIADRTQVHVPRAAVVVGLIWLKGPRRLTLLDAIRDSIPIAGKLRPL